MSSLKRSTKVFIDDTNTDIWDTLNPIITNATFPKGFVDDTPINRANAALACCAQLTRQLRELKKRVDELENVRK